jgi:DNA repair photolyase
MLAAKRYGKIKSYEDWLKPKLVENALELLDKEILKYKDDIKFVHLCFTTDPFMLQYPEVGEMSLKIIEKLNQNGIKSTVLTKGVYPQVLEDKEKYGANNEYGITLVSLDEDYRNIFEPYTSSYKERIASLKYLHDVGLKTWISIEPYPTPNISKQDLEEILKNISFVDKIVFGKLNYNDLVFSFKEHEEFYERCAIKVLSFCKKHGISYHIKTGTAEMFGETK